jgi:hypothetical protein
MIKKFVALAIAAGLGAIMAAGQLDRPIDDVNEHVALGTQLPDLKLASPSGDPVSLWDTLAEQPTLLLIVDREDCLGCGNYPLEATWTGTLTARSTTRNSHGSPHPPPLTPR